MAEFTPRLEANGIYLSKYYYSANPFHQSGYGLPNCTCYAWGRFYEISGVTPKLPLGDAGEWLQEVYANHTYQIGAVPQLGAVVCYGSKIGGAGHVAIVERINNDGTFVISQSGYYRPVAPYPPDTEDYFWTDTCDGTTMKASWMGNYEFQGFIYNPEEPIPLSPKRKMPIWMYLRYF